MDGPTKWRSASFVAKLAAPLLALVHCSSHVSSGRDAAHDAEIDADAAWLAPRAELPA
jgi:hypothetical protein